jgi:hypothetical protein
MPTKAQIRDEQLRIALDAVTENPGITAYLVGICIPVRDPDGGLVAVSAPLKLTMSLLAELEKSGRVRAVPDPKGERWYPVGEGQ